MKTWQKVGLSLATAGVTVTLIYFGLKELKKRRLKRKTEDTPAAAETSAPEKAKESSPEGSPPSVINVTTTTETKKA